MSASLLSDNTNNEEDALNEGRLFVSFKAKAMENSIMDLLGAMQQRNLVYNGRFMYYSNKSTENPVTSFHHPDGWIYSDAGPSGEIGFDEGTNSCLIKKSSDTSNMRFEQVISEFPRWKSYLAEQTVSANAVIINPASANKEFELTFSLFDGVSTNSRTQRLSPGETLNFPLQLVIDKNTSKVGLRVECSTKDAIIYVHQVYANIGNLALDVLPCIVEGVIGERKQYIATENAPAEELSLCDVAIELGENYTRLNSVLNGRFGRASSGYSMLPDMRGYFSRAWDNGAKVDPDASGRTEPGTGTIKGDHVSTFEEDAFLKHDHGLKFTVTEATTTGGGTAPTTNVVSMTASKTEEALDGKETRPKNIYELYTIKWA